MLILYAGGFFDERSGKAERQSHQSGLTKLYLIKNINENEK